MLSYLAGFFINYGAKLHMAATRTQYRLVQAIPLIPVGIAFGLSYLCPETPRYLASKQRHTEGRDALARLRGKSADDPIVKAEFETIDAQVRERTADLASVSHWTAFKETQTNANYRQRFWLLMTMQTIAQWTGGNGITYYVTNVFEVSQPNISISGKDYISRALALTSSANSSTPASQGMHNRWSRPAPTVSSSSCSPWRSPGA